MKKFILTLFNILIVSSFLIGCSSLESMNNSQKNIVVEPKEPEISSEQTLGADMAQLDYASQDTIIFHGYFGLFVYNIKESKIIRSVDLKTINCSATQGDNYCQVSVNNHGTIVQLHNMSSKDMYIYSTIDNSLVMSSYEPMENPFKLVPTVEEIKENSYAYSAESVKFDNGDLGYLVSKDFTIGTLEYICNQKIYSIFKETS